MNFDTDMISIRYFSLKISDFRYRYDSIEDLCSDLCIFESNTPGKVEGPEKGAKSAQKALQGFKTKKRDLLEGKEWKKTVLPRPCVFMFFYPQSSLIFECLYSTGFNSSSEHTRYTWNNTALAHLPPPRKEANKI